MKIELESLKNEMFENFKENEFSALSKCVGGKIVPSTWTSSKGSGTDTVDTGSMDSSPNKDTVRTAMAPSGM